jgi:hypothetical protein
LILDGSGNLQINQYRQRGRVFSISSGRSWNLASVSTKTLSSSVDPNGACPRRIFEIADAEVSSLRAKSKSEKIRSFHLAQSSKSPGSTCSKVFAMIHSLDESTEGSLFGDKSIDL